MQLYSCYYSSVWLGTPASLFLYGFVAKGNMNLLKRHFSLRAINVGNLTNKLCTDQKPCWLADSFIMSLTSPLLLCFFNSGHTRDIPRSWIVCHSVWPMFSAVYLFSDTSANEDNSFRNHIRHPKSSLAETHTDGKDKFQEWPDCSCLLLYVSARASTKTFVSRVRKKTAKNLR
jgi:hypothetical protein